MEGKVDEAEERGRDSFEAVRGLLGRIKYAAPAAELSLNLVEDQAIQDGSGVALLHRCLLGQESEIEQPLQ